jgi:hypothetical protein
MREQLKLSLLTKKQTKKKTHIRTSPAKMAGGTLRSPCAVARWTCTLLGNCHSDFDLTYPYGDIRVQAIVRRKVNAYMAALATPWRP